MMSFFSSPPFSLSKKRKKNKNNNKKKDNNNNNDNMATISIENDAVPLTSPHFDLGYHLDTNVNNDLTSERRVLTSPSKPFRVSSINTPSIHALGHSYYIDDADANHNINNNDRLHDISSTSNTNHLSHETPTTPSDDHSHHHHLHHHHHHNDQSKLSTQTKRRRSSALLHFIRGFISPESMNIQRYTACM